MGTNRNRQAPEGYIWQSVPSPAKFYAAGLAWLLYAFLFPLYLWYHFALAAMVSLAAYLIARRLRPSMTALKKLPPRVFATGDGDVDAVLSRGERILAEIDAANRRIPDERVSLEAGRITELGRKILAYVEQNPGKAKNIRRFVNYYLPTVSKLLAHYETATAQNVRAENIQGSIQRIEQALNSIVPAFQKQLDSLFLDEALDISTDITVLENMLAQEGFSREGTRLTGE